MSEILNLLGVEKSGINAIILYILLGIPLFIIIVYATTILPIQNYLQKKKSNQSGVMNNITLGNLLQKEFFTDNNIALSIFIGSQMLSISIIISHAFAYQLTGVIIFSLMAYVFQIIFIMLMEKIFNIKSFISSVIEEQNIPMSILFAFIAISISLILGSSLL